MRAETDPGEVSRRGVLDVLLSVSLLSFLGAVLYPVLRFMTPPRVAESAAASVVAAKVGEVAANSGKIFRFGTRPGILVRTTSGDWRAFSAVCTHLQCTVQFRADVEQIWCACHNGYFDLTGRNVSGPPPRPLEEYSVTVKGEDVIVSPKV
jgi:cytochrome b6-f complex iron-sulfur subunit